MVIRIPRHKIARSRVKHHPVAIAANSWPITVVVSEFVQSLGNESGGIGGKKVLKKYLLNLLRTLFYSSAINFLC